MSSFLENIIFLFALFALSASFSDRCPVCTDEQINACPVVTPSETCQLIQESNCGCCMQCARNLNENCGNGVGDCADGLACALPLSRAKGMTQDKFLNALYYGNLKCVTMDTFHKVLQMIDSENESEDDYNEIAPTVKPKRKNRGRNRKSRRNKKKKHVSSVNKSPMFPNTIETCFKHADKIYAKAIFDQHEWVPNCDGDGYYRPLQCELTHGQEMGQCWCVDHLGSPTSNYLASRSKQRKCKKGTLRGT